MTKRILVCEDEDAIREFVVINLRRAGYDVVDVPPSSLASQYALPCCTKAVADGLAQHEAGLRR